MELDVLSKEVLNSNLSDEAKIALMKLMFGPKEKEYVPPYQVSPDFEIWPTPKKLKAWPNSGEDDWWKKVEITCGDDSSWIEQMRQNAMADCVTSSKIFY